VSETVNDVNAFCGIISSQEAVNFVWFSSMILSDALILPVSQLQTQQVMT